MRAAARKHIGRIFSYIRRTGSTSRSASQCAEAAASGSRRSCRGNGRSSAADAAVKAGAAKPVPTARTLGGKSKRSYYAAACEKESHYTGKRPGKVSAGNIEGGITPDAPASDRSGGPDFPSRPARTFRVQTDGTRQNGADKRGTNRSQKAAFPSFRRGADDTPKTEKTAAFSHKKPRGSRPPTAKTDGKAGVPKSAGRFCGPRPRPPPPEPPSGRGGICPTAPVFGEKCLTRKLVCANLQSVVRQS